MPSIFNCVLTKGAKYRALDPGKPSIHLSLKHSMFNLCTLHSANGIEQEPTSYTGAQAEHGLG